MKKLLVLLVPLLVAAKSSEIPERREFPTNDKINPCSDFYEYACSKVKDTFQLREDRSRHVFAFSDSNERLLKKKENYLQGLAEKNPKKMSERAQTLRTVFKACMNKDASIAEEKKFVRDGLSEMFNIVERKKFHEFLSKRIDTPYFSFVSFGNIPDLDNSDWNNAYVTSPLQSLPERSYYDKPEIEKDYKALIEAFFKTLKLDRPKKRAQWVWEFEKEFAQVYPLPAEWREIVNKRSWISKSKLRKNYSNFDLKRFLKRIPRRTKIRYMAPEHLNWVQKALADKPLDVLKSVYLYRSVKSYMDDAYPEFYKLRFEFNRKHMGGPNKRPVRKERCTKMVMRRFRKEIDAELLPVIFPNFPEKKFRKLVERVRGSIIDGVKSNDWLQPKTKRAAIRKIKKAQLQVVKPRNRREWDFNPKAKYTETTPYQNLHNLDEKLIAKTLREMGQKRDRTRWYFGPLTVNAYYSRADNKFVMPIGILQYPFYDPKLPDHVNLGAVGSVIGHELGHGIDDKGALYDAKGRLRNWFTKRDLEGFKKRGQTLVAQFNNANPKHNGNLTLGENIGDLTGLSFAYAAAFAGSKKPDLEKEKAFFLQNGRLWCNVSRPKYEQLQLKTDPHSLPKQRVNEQVKHQPGFERAFACKKGDPMVLPDAQRVRIW